MHEFSLAQNILEIVENSVSENKGKTVTELNLDIGKASGVEIQALEMALESLKPGSVLEKAEIRMNIIECLAECTHCHHQFTAEDIYSACPECHEFNPKILNGKELIVKSIKME